MWRALWSRTLVRPALRTPAHAKVICVGGATLGGSGKTPVAIACAKLLAERGLRVTLVGHGYRARRRAARVVTGSDLDAGDEAVVCARALDGLAQVTIGPSRQEAIDIIREGSDVFVLDGPLRVASPCLSLLALDGGGGWPRAPRPVLVAVADHVVERSSGSENWDLPPRPFGLFTALARPERLISRLKPDFVVSVADHGPLTKAARKRLFELRDVAWVATEKCAIHLSGVISVRTLAASHRLPQPVADAVTTFAHSSVHGHRLDSMA